MFQPRDHEDLELAAQLVQGVMDRHPIDLDMQVLSFLLCAMQNIRMGDKYIGWRESAA